MVHIISCRAKIRGMIADRYKGQRERIDETYKILAFFAESASNIVQLATEKLRKSNVLKAGRIKRREIIYSRANLLRTIAFMFAGSRVTSMRKYYEFQVEKSSSSSTYNSSFSQ